MWWTPRADDAARSALSRRWRARMAAHSSVRSMSAPCRSAMASPWDRRSAEQAADRVDRLQAERDGQAHTPDADRDAGAGEHDVLEEDPEGDQDHAEGGQGVEA